MNFIMRFQGNKLIHITQIRIYKVVFYSTLQVKLLEMQTYYILIKHLANYTP